MLNFNPEPDQAPGSDRLIRNEMILQSIKEGVCLIDRDHRITFANASAAKMLGWKAEELVSEPFEPVLFGQSEDDESNDHPIHFVLTEGETIHVNTETFYRRDGAGFLVEYCGVPLRENNKIVGAVITFDDIGERRDLENAVVDARDAALAAAREKSDFLANMSHEIRTPLNGIIGISELLSETDLSIGQKDYLETIRTSAYLLLDIVNDMLDFSKLAAGKLELEEVDFDLREIIAKIIKLFTPQAFKKKNKLQFEIAGDVPTDLCGDPARLRQVLNNLISNAVKFTENGRILLRVSSEKDDFLRFEVSDNGIGIEPHKQKKIFEPFAQGDLSTTRQFGGTGLGLAISRQIVQMMSGEIGVESEPGRGSKFWFTAKFGCQSVVLSDWGKPEREYRIDRKDVRILVVDDNPVNQQVALGRLQQLNLSAEVAENGLKAVEFVQEKRYDLILMDCRMPQMDGFDATREIRRLEGKAGNLKIIAMTATARPDERQRCFEVGMDDYLAKPITLETLGEALEKHLGIAVLRESPDTETSLEVHPLAAFIEAKVLKNFIEIERRGERNFAAEMLNLFLKYAETPLSELQSAVANRNPELVKNKSHALRGSSGNIGLTDLFQAFTKLEEIGENDWITAEEILHEILEKFIELKTKVSHLSELEIENES